MSGFRPDPAFDAGSVFAVDWPLCHVRVQDDARFPWLILIPRVEKATEIEHLSVEDRARLMEETVEAGRRVRALGRAAGRPVDKLNVAALGNVTAQLHVHVIGRRRDDPLWPDPVWGRGGAQTYGAGTLAAMVDAFRAGSIPRRDARSVSAPD
jgi:diadenosine tetraphosphate (Ap4A) HIT family hydrolase